VARLSQTETPTQWPDSSLMLVATDGCDVTLTTDDLAGLPCLASRIKAPAAIMAVAANFFVADDIATALATRPRLSAGQLIISQDGACIGPGTLRTPAGTAATQGVLERERRIHTLTAESETAATRLQALQVESDKLEQQHSDAQAEHKTLQQGLAAMQQQLARQQAEQHGLRERVQ